MKRTPILLAAFALAALVAFGCDQGKNPATPEMESKQSSQSNLEKLKRLPYAEITGDSLRPPAKSKPAYSVAASNNAASIIVPDDYSTIQEAVNAAVSGTKILVKRAGSPYTEDVTISGDGIRLMAAGGVTLNGSFIVWGNDVVIEKFHIDATNSTFSEGIRVNYASGVKIRHNAIKAAWRGIELYQASGNSIEKNKLTQAQANAIFLSESNENRIIKNACRDNSQGMNMVFSANNVVSGNNFSNNNSLGLEVSNTSSQNRFVHNRCNRNGSIGIKIFGDANNNIFGPKNTANFNGQYGIILFSGISGNLVVKNDFHCNGSQDIFDLGTDTHFIKNRTGPLPKCQ